MKSVGTKEIYHPFPLVTGDHGGETGILSLSVKFALTKIVSGCEKIFYNRLR